MKDGVINKYSNESVHALWMNSIDGVRLIDSFGNIVYVNDSFCTLVGLSKEVLIDKSFCFPFMSGNSVELENPEYFLENIKNRCVVPYYKTNVTLLNKKTCSLEVTNIFITEKNDKNQLLSVFRKLEEGSVTSSIPEPVQNLSKTERNNNNSNFSEFKTQPEHERGKNNENEIPGLLDVSSDVMERKKTEQLIRENKNYLSKIINTIGDPLFVKNSEYKCVLANNAFCSMLAAEYSAVVGKYDYELFNPEECKAYNVEDDFVLLTGHESLKEESYIDQQGEKHTVLTKKTRYVDEYGNKYVVGTISDITELKDVDRLLRQSLENERKLNNMRTDFISMVSHEFRTPLTTILSSMQIVQQYEDLLKEEKEEIFNRVYDSIKKMILLLEDILILGGTESGKAVFKPSPCDLSVLCLDVIKDINLNFNRDNLIKFEIQDNLNRVIADTKLLRQILNNLLSNAVKYSPDGGDIKLKVYTNNQFVCFDVEDKGLGINTSDQDEIFKPFFRCLNSMGISGTGLGLAIVKKSVDLHSGSISFISQPGIGTTFFVKIPYLMEYSKGIK